MLLYVLHGCFIPEVEYIICYNIVCGIIFLFLHVHTVCVRFISILLVGNSIIDLIN